MTEYDYSPEAYERHLANLDRVSRWVNKQAHHSVEYTNPFINPDVHHRSDSRHRDRDRDRSSSRHARGVSPNAARPGPNRSQTTPDSVPLPAGPNHLYQQPRIVTPPSGYRPTHHKSYSTHQVHQHPPLPLPPPPPPQVSYMSGSGHRSGYSTKTYTLDPSAGEIHLPPPRRGEQYIIIPPKGRSVQVVHDYSDGSRTSSWSSASRSPQSPTKKGPPLLKRLFTFGNGGVSGGPPPHRSKGSSSSSRERRLSY